MHLQGGRGQFCNSGESGVVTRRVRPRGKAGGSLRTYRFYRLDGLGRICAAEWVDAADDEEARSKVRTQTVGGQYELWERNRLLERVTGLSD